jgi:hypothetical protein
MCVGACLAAGKRCEGYMCAGRAACNGWSACVLYAGVVGPACLLYISKKEKSSGGRMAAEYGVLTTLAGMGQG